MDRARMATHSPTGNARSTPYTPQESQPDDNHLGAKQPQLGRGVVQHPTQTRIQGLYGGQIQ